jgi:sodium/potassium-transporting ATPase subunit alpha
MKKVAEVKEQVHEAKAKVAGGVRQLIEQLESVKRKVNPMQKRRDKKAEERRKNIKPHDYHKLSNDELEKMFNTSLTQGLTDARAKQLLAENGKNELAKPETHRIKKFLSYILAGFCWILWISFFVSIIAYCITDDSDPTKSTNIGLAVLIILVIGLGAGFEAFQDWSSSKVMKSIKNLMPSECHAIRNGVEITLPTSDLVVGDLVILTNGTKVPADLRLIESNDLKFDRSMITGESEAIEGMINCTDEIYSESKNVSFMTSLVTNGNGKGFFLIFYIFILILISNMYLKVL